MLNQRSLLKSGQILVHLNSSSLPAFNCLLCLQDNSVNKLTCAIFSWPSFGHIPLLCFLERLLGLTWTEKNWTFVLEALFASKKTARSFSTNFNMFQVSQSICTFSVSGEFGLAEPAAPEETVSYVPLAKTSIAIAFVARLLHQRQPLTC